MQVSIKQALNQLGSEGVKLFEQVMAHGSMSVEIYRPNKVDLQTPHLQDELYVIASGTGEFFNNGKTSKFQSGDVLFVPAGIEHRFLNFSDEFSTWVIFYGPQGGEQQAKSL